MDKNYAQVKVRCVDCYPLGVDNPQVTQGKIIIIVEQNAKKGLEFADIVYVLISGGIAIAETDDDLLSNPEIGKLFLGG